MSCTMSCRAPPPPRQLLLQAQRAMELNKQQRGTDVRLRMMGAQHMLQVVLQHAGAEADAAS